MSEKAKVTVLQIIGAVFALSGLSIVALSMYREIDLSMGQNVIIFIVTSFGIVTLFPKAASVVISGVERLIITFPGSYQ